MRISNIAIATLVATVSLATIAKADTFTATAFGVGVNEGGAVGAAPGNVTSFTENGVTVTNIGGSVQVKTPPSDGNGAVPFNIGGNYLSVLGGGTASLTFAATNIFGFYWGSIDPYNTVEFLLGGISKGSLTGTNAALQASLIADGNQGSYNSNRYVRFTDTGGTFDEIRLTSSQNSFEIANIGAIPEPSTWAMMILGFLGLGFLGYRKSSKSSFRMA